MPTHSVTFSEWARGGWEAIVGTGEVSFEERAVDIIASPSLPPCLPRQNEPCMQIIDKNAFWSRVRVGQERADTLAREVFCQSLLTRDVDDYDDDEIALQEAQSSHQPSQAYESKEIPRDGQGGEQQHHYHRHQQRQLHQQASVVVGKRDELGRGPALRRRGGGIVRLHSVLETADELVRSRVFVISCYSSPSLSFF